MKTMTRIERVVTTLSHQEADRVPFFLTLTMHGAQELGMSLNEYFAKPEHVAEGQIRMLHTYRHDFIYTFFYAAVEVEAWGGEVLYSDDGPPNAAQPFIRTPEDIDTLDVPVVAESPSLVKVLRATEMIRSRLGPDVPIVGVVMAPHSLPVMQMGFEHYLNLMYEQPARFERLMQINEAFCLAWANAQFAAGATAIGYFDPVSSPTITTPAMYRKTALPITKRLFANMQGPAATLLASGKVMPILDDILQTGTALVGASMEDDMAAMKAVCRGKATVIGNLNGIEMCRWSEQETEAHVKQAIAAAARGGGFILCDNHGEIPWQVPSNTLLAIADAVETWGRYPLDWVEHNEPEPVHHRM